MSGGVIMNIDEQAAAAKKPKHFIFRWKDSGICVESSRSRSADECWAYALEWLRPASGPRAVGRAMVRKNGEVIEDDE